MGCSSRDRERCDWEVAHAHGERRPGRVLRVERLLLLWDELDDLAGACRHVALFTADEVASLAAPLGAFASALGAGLLTFGWHAPMSLIGNIASTYLAL